jgi:hypothetical protein
MKDLDAQAFAALFKDVYRRCFAGELATPLTEAECIHLSVAIEESTGLEIGWKSLKNYSQHVLGVSPEKPENPSTPTLDTLARYVAGAPATDSSQRRARERHYPYWFRYQEEFRSSPRRTPVEPQEGRRARVSGARVAVALAGTLVALALLTVMTRPLLVRSDEATTSFLDEFDDVSDAALAARGWSVAAVDSAHWAERGASPGHLTLFTLRGDNWPQAGTPPAVKNLLVRRVPSECFVAELRFDGFVPEQNWQQAGILVLEDTAFAGNTLRLSLGFNDFAGGFPESAEIRLQAITSMGRAFPNPEEIAQRRLFALNTDARDLIAANLEHAALRIERRGNRYRLLYSNGPMENAAFKEVAQAELAMRPAYVGIFALKGFVTEAADLPVYVDAFSLAGSSCDD